jgi:23S rRNA pseudouridine2605 synthase
MLHKPKGLEVTRPKNSRDEIGSRTVYSVLPLEFHVQGWVPVGRLDKDSSGLLLFVREGFLVRLLQTPGNIPKVYEVWVKGHLKPEHLRQILRGIETPLGILRAKAVETLGTAGPNTLVKLTLDEGKNRQIRRMFSSMKDVGLNRYFKAVDLSRVSIGPVSLDVEPGRWRFLTEKETEAVLSCLPKKLKTAQRPKKL